MLKVRDDHIFREVSCLREMPCSRLFLERLYRDRLEQTPHINGRTQPPLVLSVDRPFVFYTRGARSYSIRLICGARCLTGCRARPGSPSGPEARARSTVGLAARARRSEARQQWTNLISKGRLLDMDNSRIYLFCIQYVTIVVL